MKDKETPSNLSVYHSMGIMSAKIRNVLPVTAKRVIDTPVHNV